MEKKFARVDLAKAVVSKVVNLELQNILKAHIMRMNEAILNDYLGAMHAEEVHQDNSEMAGIDDS